MDPNGTREFVPLDFAAIAKWITRALQNESKRRDSLQMLDAQALGFADRMERISQTHKSCNARFIGNQAGDAAAHRLAANDEAFAAKLCYHFVPGIAEHFFAVRRPLLSCLAVCRHVRELEARDTEAPIGEARGESGHEWSVHACAGSVGQGDGPRTVLCPINKDLRRSKHVCSKRQSLGE